MFISKIVFSVLLMHFVVLFEWKPGLHFILFNFFLKTRPAWPRQFMDRHHGVCEEPQKDKQGFSHHRHLSSPVSDFFSSSFRNLNNRKRLACFVPL